VDFQDEIMAAPSGPRAIDPMRTNHAFDDHEAKARLVPSSQSSLVEPCIDALALAARTRAARLSRRPPGALHRHYAQERAARLI
jgi:hypothetical protein